MRSFRVRMYIGGVFYLSEVKVRDGEDRGGCPHRDAG